ncbi:MAG: hypothetical protein U0Q11_12675 [Vicinamibacterales bacterium]
MSERRSREKSINGADAPKRGRPPKFGRPGHAVSVTLPDDTLQALNKVDPDTGWAIVKLLEREPREAKDAREPDVELAHIGTRRSLIVVSRAVFKTLPGVNLIPLDETRAFLALEPGSGLSDLELAVIDRMSDNSVNVRERRALEALRVRLAAWRHDRHLRFHNRSIIVVEQVSSGRGGTKTRRVSA